MRNILKAVGVFILIGVLIGFFVSDNSSSSIPDSQPNIEQTDNSSQTTTEDQPAPTGQDPFKKFLDEKSNNTNLYVNTDNSKVAPLNTGKDPFKEFLDKQKKNSKDQVVSPFGKN